MTVRLVRRAALLPLAAVLLAGCRAKSPAGRYEGPYADQVNAAMPRVEKGVGLPFKSVPKVALRTRKEVNAFVAAQFDDPLATRTLQGSEVAYKRLGVIPDSLHLKSYLVALLGEQIVGFYDPKTKTLYVTENTPPEAVGLTLTHELVHALQDQYVNLDSVRNVVSGDTDRELAFSAFMEGQATFEQVRILQPNAEMGGLWDRAREGIRMAREAMPLMADAPVFIREEAIFPYFGGAEFVRRLKAHRGDRSPFDSLPTSTEQILQESAYFDTPRDVPTRVTLPPLRGATSVYQNDLGEFEVRLWLFQLLKSQDDAARGAAGWDGDRYAVIDTPQGEGIVWLSVWDSAVDAGDFLDLARQAAAKRYGGKAGANGIVTGGGRTVAVTAGEVGGRPVVVWTDVPQGAPTDLLDLSRVRLEQP